MKWFAAHIMMVLRSKIGAQPIFPVLENIVLLRDVDARTAWEQAMRRGRSEETDAQGTQRLEDGTPAKWEFLGVRKVVECEDSDESPSNGTEVSYSEYSVTSEAALSDLREGSAVNVCYEAAGYEDGDGPGAE